MGRAGNDVLYGGWSHDTLDGGIGAHTLIGGAGDDTYIVNAARDVVNEAVDALNGGFDRVLASVSWTLGAGSPIAVLQARSALGLTLTGNEGANRVIGGAGSDVLDGGGESTRSGARRGPTPSCSRPPSLRASTRSWTSRGRRANGSPWTMR